MWITRPASAVAGMIDGVTVVQADWRDSVDGAELADVLKLLAAAQASDGQPELAGDGLPGDFRGGVHLLARKEDTLVGYAHLDTAGDAFGRQVATVIVRPDRRRQGIGSAMVGAVLDRSAGNIVRFWSRDDHPGAAAIARRLGLARVRELLRMGLDLATAPEFPEPVWPDGVRVRTFVPGQDERAMLDVNARAFDWHPEQGALSIDELTATEREAWFDPAGFFLAERAGRVIGFHWTKVHPLDPPVGEVYVVGVDPDAQGGGLGRALTLVGLHHLRAAGLTDVILYVEGDNAPALAVYHRLGFTRTRTDVQYEASPSTNSA